MDNNTFLFLYSLVTFAFFGFVVWVNTKDDKK